MVLSMLIDERPRLGAFVGGGTTEVGTRHLPQPREVGTQRVDVCCCKLAVQAPVVGFLSLVEPDGSVVDPPPPVCLERVAFGRAAAASIGTSAGYP